MVKPIRVFQRQSVPKQDGGRSRGGFTDKLTHSLEQSTVNSERVILPYSPGLLKLSQ